MRLGRGVLNYDRSWAQDAKHLDDEDAFPD